MSPGPSSGRCPAEPPPRAAANPEAGAGYTSLPANGRRFGEMPGQLFMGTEQETSRQPSGA